VSARTAGRGRAGRCVVDPHAARVGSGESRISTDLHVPVHPGCNR
jgi:hypothetical protein